MLIIIPALLGRCSSLHILYLAAQMICRKNLTRLTPEIQESRADKRLPYYTAGFV